ncbi:MAG: ABC transporter permease [Alphaproteobacteria bacterium]|nr:ABC transporter permease [Alphaproteobacteria bacterium]
MLLLKLATRNLLRNTRRTLITMAGISLGLAMMMGSNNLAFGSHQDMLRTAIGLLAGHVVVQAEGYQEENDAELVVTDSTAVAEQLRQAFPDASVGRRLLVDGLITSPTNARGAALRGVEPSAEAKVIDLDDKVIEGEWLADDDDRGILMGEEMVDALGIEIGDKVVFMAQPDGDEVQSKLFRLRGIYRTGSPEIDGYIAIVPLQAAQGLYQAKDPATQIAVHLDSDRQTLPTWERATQVVTADGLEVLPWQKAIPDVYEFVKLDSAYSDGIWFVLGLIVAMGVVNTVLMSVLERVREFGVMMAVGLKPLKLALMVLAEGLVLGMASAVIGVGLGLLLSWPLVVYGIDMSSMGESMETAGVPLSMHMYAEIDWARLFVYPFIGIGFSVLASLYPAWKVTRLSPIEAIQHQ